MLRRSAAHLLPGANSGGVSGNAREPASRAICGYSGFSCPAVCAMSPRRNDGESASSREAAARERQPGGLTSWFAASTVPGSVHGWSHPAPFRPPLNCETLRLRLREGLVPVGAAVTAVQMERQLRDAVTRKAKSPHPPGYAHAPALSAPLGGGGLTWFFHAALHCMKAAPAPRRQACLLNSSLTKSKAEAGGAGGPEMSIGVESRPKHVPCIDGDRATVAHSPTLKIAEASRWA